MQADDNFWGSLIRDLRVKQNITQRTLSTRAEVNRTTLRHIELGRATGDIRTMERILHYLGYELEAMEREGLGERLRRQAERERDPEKRSMLAAQRVLTLFS